MRTEVLQGLRDYVSTKSPKEESLTLLAGFTNPIEFSREVLGLEILTEPQEKFLTLICDQGFRGRFFLRGGHGGGKTLVMAAALHFAWGPLASVVRNGKPTGCRLLLSSTTAKSIQGTIYGQLVDLAEVAKSRGYDIPGFEPRTGDRYSGASRQSVGWHTADHLWKMEALTASAKADGGISSGMSGRHHKGIQIVCTEEAEGGHAGGFAAMAGLTVAGNTCWLAATNPTSIFSPFGEMIEKDPGAWSQIGFAVYEHPNIIERREVIPGCASHLAMDAILRTPAFEDRGPDAIPESDRLDFWYALPSRDMVDKEGPRPDGIPGHPDATPHVFRPATPLAAGQWCSDFLRSDDRQLLFAVNEIRRMMLSGEHATPDRPPDQVGLDCHPSKNPKACARWGPSARTAIDSGAAERIIKVSRPVDVAWIGETELDQAASAAKHLVDLFGTKTTYSIDQAGGGAVAVLMKKEGAKVSLVPFVAPPRSPPTELYGKVLNVRVEMHVHAAAVFNSGIVSASYSAEILKEMGATGPLIPAGESGLKAASLRKKEEMEEAMDALDAVILALDEPPTEPVLIPVFV